MSTFDSRNCLQHVGVGACGLISKQHRPKNSFLSEDEFMQLTNEKQGNNSGEVNGEC